MTSPITVRWDCLVTHPATRAEDTEVHCLAADGTRVVLLLDDELREALALSLLDPDGEMDQP